MAWVNVEVDLDDVSDEEIIEEYNSRGLGDDSGFSDAEILNKIWIHDREGRKEEAYALMREYVYAKLNKVV